MTRIEWLTYDHFAPRVGDAFALAADGGAPLELRLSDATQSAEPGGPGPEGQERAQFSLLFHGPADGALAQGTYRLTHEELGELDLFLVPLGPDGAGMRYEAAFA